MHEDRRKITPPKCVCCGSDLLVPVGEIPPAIFFAGRVLSAPLQGGTLFRCGNCGLDFRYPRLDKEKIDTLYRQGKIDNWQGASAVRVDWLKANKWISRYLKIDASILDVGCFNGGFLRLVGSNHGKFGVEIHEAAGTKAQTSGINIIGKDYNMLLEARMVFDAVTSFDVIEHTHNPFNFLAALAGVTREKGIIILSTGNSAAISWKILGSKYWYCSIGEHLSFVNPRWCEWAASRLGIGIRQVIKFSHVRSTWLRRINEAAKNIAYAITPRGFSALRAIGIGASEYRKHKAMLSYPPSWMTAKDHFICLFVKK